MTKKNYKVSGMSCASCAKMIEIDLEDIGVKASCNYVEETLNIEFDESQIEESKIKKILIKSGYNLVDIEK